MKKNTAININDIQSVLILQTAFIGDVTLALFFANELKQINPNIRIIFVTTKISAPIVQCVKSIDCVIVLDKKKKHKKIKDMKLLAKKINRECRIDMLFSLHRSFRSTLFSRFINAKCKVGFNNSVLSFLYDIKVKYFKNLHETERNRQMLSIFNDVDIKNSKSNKIDLEFEENDIKIANKLLENLSTQKRIVALAIGSVWATKRWKYNYFEELTQKIIANNYNIILIGSEAERKESEVIADRTGALSLAGKTTLAQTLNILNEVSLLITNDSAPTHFASILDVPTITIFGPTSSIFGFAPLAKHSLIAEDKELFCRPCSIHGQKKCPRENHQCMANVTPEYVYDLAENILNKCEK